MVKRADITVTYEFTPTGCFKLIDNAVICEGEGIIKCKPSVENGHISICVVAELNTRIHIRMKNTPSSAPMLWWNVVPHNGQENPMDSSSTRFMCPGGLYPPVPLKMKTERGVFNFDIEPERECPGPAGSSNTNKDGDVRVRYHTSWHVEC